MCCQKISENDIGLSSYAANRLGQVPYEPHMLDAASSPLISALPQYERSFLDHLSIGQAYHGAIQASTAFCLRIHQHCKQ